MKNAPVNISHVVDVVQGLEHPLQDVSNRQLIHAIHEVRTDEILCGTWRKENRGKVGKGNREGKRHVSQLTTEFLEPFSARTPFPLTICHEWCDNPQLIVCNKGGSIWQDVGMVEEFRDVKLPLKAMVSWSQSRSSEGWGPTGKWQRDFCGDLALSGCSSQSPGSSLSGGPPSMRETRLRHLCRKPALLCQLLPESGSVGQPQRASGNNSPPTVQLLTQPWVPGSPPRRWGKRTVDWRLMKV